MNLNHAAFLRFMRSNGHETRTDIGNALGLHKSTISRVLNNKSEAGGRFVTAFKTAFPNERIDDYFAA